MTTKFKDDEIVIATTSMAVDGVDELVIRKGTRLRGSHAAVRKVPHLFVRDTTPQNEWPPEFTATIEAEMRADERRRAEEPKSQPETIPVDEAAECVEAFQLGPRGRSFNVGQLVRLSDPIVLEHPKFFRLPRREIPT